MTLLDRIRALLQSDGVPSQEGRDEIRFLARCGDLSVSMSVALGPELVVVYSQLPIFGPTYRRAALCETIARANFGLYLGCFEMDVDDGDLRFRSSLATNDSEPSDNQVRRLISSSIGVIAHYGHAILDVACTDVEPVMAIKKADAHWEQLHCPRTATA